MTITASFKVAFNGLWKAFREQRNLKIHAVCGIAVMLLGFFTHLQRWEWCAVLICIGLVISAELLNTALETLTDLVSPHYNELAGKAKDIAAAGVLAASIISAIVAAIIFIPHFAV
ncbi:MAG: diacylglycerol kinase family protein [Chitinophagales bacterium]